MVALVVALLLIVSPAFAESSTSLWEQMRSGQTNRVRVHIKSLEILPNGVQIEYQHIENSAKKGRTGSTHIASLCEVSSVEGIDTTISDSEARRAALLQERMQVLRDALQSNRAVELATEGPWSECISSIRVSSIRQASL